MDVKKDNERDLISTIYPTPMYATESEQNSSTQTLSSSICKLSSCQNNRTKRLMNVCLGGHLFALSKKFFENSTQAQHTQTSSPLLFKTKDTKDKVIPYAVSVRPDI